MSPELAAVVGACSALAVLLVIALVVDHFFGPLPVVRKVRGWLGVVLGVLLAIVSLGLLKRPKKPAEDPKPEPVDPKEFNDDVATDNKKAALDTDVARAGDAARRPSTDDLQSELDNL